ncbi:MAG: hypothetical protein H6517_01775 [Microthrixaceae bacterium]|nr:hypothetical protein [Microthrixaceae bacterium]
MTSGARRPTRALGGLASRANWWLTATVGSIGVVILSLPQFLATGTQGPVNYPWYVTADGDVLRGLIIDQTQYLRLVEHFTNEAPDLVVRPFSQRALAPWVAGWVPADAAVSLFVVNVLALVGATFLLASLVRYLTHNRTSVVAAVAVWVISFPVFWYTGKALVDAAAVGMSVGVLWSLYRSQRLLGAVALLAAVWTKEATVLLVVPAVVFELLAGERHSRARLVRSGVWVAVAVCAYLSRGLLVDGLDVTFATWIPPSVESARGFLLNNLGGFGGLGQFVLTVVPVVVALGLWVPQLRREGFGSANADAWSLVFGMLSAVALGLWSLWSALFDGRTAWLAVPQAALLIALAVDRQEHPFRALRRRFTIPRVVAGGAMCLLAWVLALVLVSAGGVFAPGSDPGPAGFAHPPDTTSDHSWEVVEGVGDTVLPTPEATPFLVRYRSEEPARIEGPGELLPRAATTQGLVLADTGGESGGLEIVTPGSWVVDIVQLDGAMPWEGLSPVAGNGPTVLLMPGGLRRPVRVAGSFDDESARVVPVGNCEPVSCEGIGADSFVMEVGTEALVVDAEGPWELSPEVDSDTG